jgi:hypothetical protein
VIVVVMVAVLMLVRIVWHQAFSSQCS